MNSNNKRVYRTFVLKISAKWSGDRTGQYSKTGALINTILSVLEDLDGYVFERLDSSANCLDSLYSRLFDQVTTIHDTESELVAQFKGLFSSVSLFDSDSARL